MMSLMFYFYWIEVMLIEFVNFYSMDILFGFIGFDERERYNNRILNIDFIVINVFLRIMFYRLFYKIK